MISLLPAFAFCYLSLGSAAVGHGAEPLQAPFFRSVDLDIGQSRKVTLADGTTVTVKLLEIREKRDPVRQALRGADVTVEVNGVRGVLPCATHHLPTRLSGIRIDCPVVKG
jgi:hypothetical protein